MQATGPTREVDLEAGVPDWVAPLVVEESGRRWIRAYKRARLLKDGDEPRFRPLVTSDEYGRNARAICARDAVARLRRLRRRYGVDDLDDLDDLVHDAPDSGCNCGFHALTARDDAVHLHLMRGEPGAVLLEVLLGGRVIVGRWGRTRAAGKHVRAELQVVTSYAVISTETTPDEAGRIFDVPDALPPPRARTTPEHDVHAAALEYAATSAPDEPETHSGTAVGAPDADDATGEAQRDAERMARLLGPGPTPPPDIGVLARLPRSPRYPFGGRAVAIDLSAPFDVVSTPDPLLNESRERITPRNRRRAVGDSEATTVPALALDDWRALANDRQTAGSSASTSR